MDFSRISRRDFLKFSLILTATMGLPVSYVDEVKAALQAKKKPTVAYLEFYGVYRLYGDFTKVVSSSFSKTSFRDY